ncbi:hypothetical protein ASE03_21975 [Kitasatospora sp. Root187]|nr:hypothetical protein ASC99_23085 [Kitasatospora sp. Root107]KRB72933.1 hypothetical protein ASE03_21975 [Kitasatospora sp. Root187]
MSRSAATVTAALVLSVGLPVVAGGSSAWAVCGSDLKGRTQSQPHPAKHQGELTVTQLKSPAQVTVGGAAVDVPVRITNNTDGDYRAVEPAIGLGHFVDGHDLTVKDVQASWRKGTGSWHPLALQPGCTRGLVNEDEALPMLALRKGESVELTFRVGVPAGAPTGLGFVTYSVSATGEDWLSGNAKGGRLSLVRPKASPAPAPVRATASSAPTATAAELAETGPRTPNTLLLTSAAAFVALGAAILLTVRRLGRR